MSHHAPTVVLLTVRGTVAPATLDDARDLHNMSAGSDQAIAGARALGDLSHNVYLRRGVEGSREVLFVDTWTSAEGIGTFFSDPMVQQSAGALFSDRHAVVWAPAEGAGDVVLPAPGDRPVAAIGVLRAPAVSAEAVTKAFAANAARIIGAARVHGQVSRQTFLRLGAPGEPIEVISIDSWFDVAGMDAFYEDMSNYAEFADAFAGPPDTNTWQPAAGWREW